MQTGVRGRPRHRFQWPWEVHFSEWKQIARNVVQEIGRDNVPMVAAALSYYALIALFPGLVALVSVYGLLADPATLEAQLRDWSTLLPSSAFQLLDSQLRAIVGASRTGLSLGLAASVMAALWGASSGVDSLIEAVNLAYDKEEHRSWIKRRLLSLAFTLGLIAFVITAIGLIAVLPGVLALVSQEHTALRVIQAARWPALAVTVALGLMILYRYAPCREKPARWASGGALLSALLWLGASGLFSLYVSHFASYNKTYGALGGVIALLLWFYISAFVVLIGAQVTAELEGEKRG